jgi:prepilin-type N-terminal cleavage/methylation domain-containing protein
MKKGFTLIELLVVITLIGILAIAVLSALNPIEQINKARDARKRADASQTLKAIDRYFASNERFPWNNFTDTDDVDDLFSATSNMIGVGVCGDAAETTNPAVINSDSSGCEEDGFLISTQELKVQFGKRDYFKDGDTVAGTDLLYIYKGAADPSVSVCFIPASKATRDTAGAEGTALKNLAVSSGVATQIEECDSDSAPEPEEWGNEATACFVCIPEE